MVREDYIPTIDLHRLTHHDAGRETIRFVERYWNTGRYVEIITGNSDKMKKVVMDILDEYKVDHRVGRTFDLTNRGYITCTL